MGWNATRQNSGNTAAAIALRGLADGAYFYFVHSYFAAPDRPEDIALVSEHGVSFCAAVARDNIFACQFHPEKSQDAGLALLSSFVAV